MIPEKEVPTPTKVQSLQRTLYRKAKEDPRWRAWSLYGDLLRRDVLETALATVLRNGGAAGVDHVTTEAVEANAPAFLDGLPNCATGAIGSVPFSESGYPKRMASKGHWVSRR